MKKKKKKKKTEDQRLSGSIQNYDTPSHKLSVYYNTTSLHFPYKEKTLVQCYGTWPLCGRYEVRVAVRLALV